MAPFDRIISFCVSVARLRMRTCSSYQIHRSYSARCQLVFESFIAVTWLSCGRIGMTQFKNKVSPIGHLLRPYQDSDCWCCFLLADSHFEETSSPPSAQPLMKNLFEFGRTALKNEDTALSQYDSCVSYLLRVIFFSRFPTISDLHQQLLRYAIYINIESTVPNTALAIFQGTTYWLSTRHGGRIRSNLHRLLKGVDITTVSWATSDEGGYWRYLGKYKKLETKDFDHKMPLAQYPSKSKHTQVLCWPIFSLYTCLLPEIFLPLDALHGLRPTVQNENGPVLLYCRLILATKSTKTDFPQAGVPLAMMSLYNSVRAIIPLTKWEEIYDMLFERVLRCCSINQ